MRSRSVSILIVTLLLPALASADIQTFTATHTYILGDHDSKDDARQRCLLEAKRKVLEQAGVYMESASEVKDLQLTKDTIASFAAVVMQVKDTSEEVAIQNGQMSLTLTITAQVDLAEMRRQLAARQVDGGVRDTVAAQQERLKHLEVQLEAMQQQMQVGHVPVRTPVSQPGNISSTDLQTLHTWAARGDARAQFSLGVMYANGIDVSQDYERARHWYGKAAAQGDPLAQASLGVLYASGLGGPQDYEQARQWFEKAATQGDASAQGILGVLYLKGDGVLQDYAQARQWFEKAAARGNALAQESLGSLYAKGAGVSQDYLQARWWWEKAAAQGDTLAQNNLGVLYDFGQGVPQDYVRAYMWYSLAAAYSSGAHQKLAADNRNNVLRRMTPAQIAEAQRLSQQCQAQQFKGC